MSQKQRNEVIDETTGEVILHDAPVEVLPELPNDLTGNAASNRQLITFDEHDLTAVHGLKVTQGLSFKDRVQVLRFVSSMIGGESESVDRYLNRTLTVAGVLQHEVQVRVEKEGMLDAMYIPRTRTVIIVAGADGRMFPENKKIAFVAKSADSFFSKTVIPLLGLGMWQESINLIVRNVTSRGGRAYTFEVV